mmetsp:Transcript_76189/g.176752  ORF Transcript_76189/g.176752 Transcript_76189/m.176752 type:complete len:214 (+) Transcript_76189:693-1334(+)
MRQDCAMGDHNNPLLCPPAQQRQELRHPRAFVLLLHGPPLLCQICKTTPLIQVGEVLHEKGFARTHVALLAVPAFRAECSDEEARVLRLVAVQEDSRLQSTHHRRDHYQVRIIKDRTGPLTMRSLALLPAAVRQCAVRSRVSLRAKVVLGFSVAHPAYPALRKPTPVRPAPCLGSTRCCCGGRCFITELGCCCHAQLGHPCAEASLCRLRLFP